jgi:hypothetical protein
LSYSSSRTSAWTSIT